VWFYPLAHSLVNSDYSSKDGAQSVKQIAARAKELGMPAVALTDHGSCGGLLQFKKACEKEGVKAILGCELYLAPELRTTRGKLADHTKTSYHITVLAKNDNGLRNIFKLCSIGWLEGYYYKPRVDMEVLRKHSDDLVVLSGCGSGRAAHMFSNDRDREAVEWLEECKDIWGEDFYIELQNHGLDWQKKQYDSLVIAAESLKIKTVVTQDSHYPLRKDAELHGYICKLNAGDLTFDSDHSWFKSEEEIMEMAFDAKWKQAVHNTLEVADKCTGEWNYGDTIWPEFKLEENETPDTKLKDDVMKGFSKLFGEGTKVHTDRIEYELGVIQKMGFSTYFLVVADFINWAKDNGIAVGPGRGCFLPGSLVKTKNNDLVAIEDIKINDHIISHDGTINKVTNTLEYDVSEDIIELEFDDGKIIKCTLDHEIHTTNRGWVKAIDLHEDDIVTEV